MRLNNKYFNTISLIAIQIILSLNLSQSASAMESFSESSQNEARDKSGVFIFSSKEHSLDTKNWVKILAMNGLDEAAIRFYVESATFGFKDFSKEVITHSSNLNNVMVIFHFHGAEAGGCIGCNVSSSCLQGNLCAAANRIIPAQQIVDDFLIPLEGKKIGVFFQSCFSGHFAKKVEQIASRKAWNKPTPIALIATDNNKPTSAFYFPYPNYSRKRTQFNHWTNIECASKYENMHNFYDYVEFVNSSSTFNFTFFALNGGEEIKVANFGFKNLSFRPAQEIKEQQMTYRNIEAKLRNVDVSNLLVLIVERERTYENLKHGDMWLNAFLQNGIPQGNIHWIKREKIDADIDNPQIHALSDNLDFITPKNKVLLFIRGDDVIKEPKQWSMMLDCEGAHTLSAERIATILIPQLSKGMRLLVLMCSTHADLGFEQLLAMPDRQELKNITVVSFYFPERKWNRTNLCGWPMGFLAPLYAADYLFYTNGDFLDAFPKDADLREKATRGLKLFENMSSFENYLEFLQKVQHFFIPKDTAIKIFNAGHNDLIDFGFLPQAMPKSWYRW